MNLRELTGIRLFSEFVRLRNFDPIKILRDDRDLQAVAIELINDLRTAMDKAVKVGFTLELIQAISDAAATKLLLIYYKDTFYTVPCVEIMLGHLARIENENVLLRIHPDEDNIYHIEEVTQRELFHNVVVAKRLKE